MPTLQVAINSSGATQGASEYEAAIRRMQRDSASATQGIQRVEKSFGTLHQIAQTVKQTLIQTATAFGFGYGSFQGIQQGVAALFQFDDALKSIQAASQTTDAQLAETENLIREIGFSGTYTANQVAQGILVLSKAGMSTQDALKAIPPIMDLAVAGTLQFGQAAELANDLVNSFNYSLDEFRRVADVLVKTDLSATTSVEDLGAAMRFAAPLAFQAGLSIEELAASVAVLSDNNIKGALAGTSIRQTIASLLNPTKELQRVLTTAGKQAGLTLQDFSVTANSYTKVFENLKKLNLSPEELVKGFSARGLAGVGTITKDLDAFKTKLDGIIQAGGTAKEVAHIMEDDLPAATDRFKSAIQELTLSLGRGGLSDSLRELIDFSTQVVRVLAGVYDPLGQISNNARFAAKGVEFLTTAGGVFIALQLPRVIISLMASMKALQVVMLNNPLSIFIASAAVVAGLLVVLRNDLIEFGNENVRVGALVNQSWNYIIDGFRDVYKAYKELYEYIKANPLTFAEAFPTLDAWIKSLKAGIEVINEFDVKVTKGLAEVFSPTLIPLDQPGQLGPVYSTAQFMGPPAYTGPRIPTPFVHPYEGVNLTGPPYTHPEGVIATVVEKAKIQTKDEIYANKMNEDIKKKFEELEKARRTFRQSFEEEFSLGREMDLESQAIENARTQLQELTDTLQFEMSMVGRSAEAREAAIQAREFETLAIKAQIETIKELNAIPIGTRMDESGEAIATDIAYDYVFPRDVKDETEQFKRDFERLQTIQKETEITEDARQKLEELNDEIKKEIDLIGLSGRERDIAIKLREYESVAMKAQISNVAELAAKYEQQLQMLKDSEELAVLADGIGTAFGDAFLDIATGAQTAEQAILQMGNTIARLILQMTVATPIANSISKIINVVGAGVTAGAIGAFGAGGGGGDALSGVEGAAPPNTPDPGSAWTPTYASKVKGQMLKKFATGGYVDKPTFGMVGESGPEIRVKLMREITKAPTKDALLKDIQNRIPEPLVRIIKQSESKKDLIDKLTSKSDSIVRTNNTDSVMKSVFSKLDNKSSVSKSDSAMKSVLSKLSDSKSDSVMKSVFSKIDSTKLLKESSSSAMTPKRFASGGLVTHATYGMVGEAGPELIIPLTSPYGAKALDLGGILDAIPWREVFAGEGSQALGIYQGIRELGRQIMTGQGIAAGGPGRLLHNVQAMLNTAIPNLSAVRDQWQTFGPTEAANTVLGYGGDVLWNVANFAMDKLIPAPSIGQVISNPALGLANYAFHDLRATVNNPMYGLPGYEPSTIFGQALSNRFADGGIVNRMTYFQQNNGRSGVMGEAGPEAIVPLTRDSRGRLGVANIGGGGSGTTVINMTVNTPDADSFRKSKRQLISDMKRLAR